MRLYACLGWDLNRRPPDLEFDAVTLNGWFLDGACLDESSRHGPSKQQLHVVAIIRMLQTKWLFLLTSTWCGQSIRKTTCSLFIESYSINFREGNSLEVEVVSKILGRPGFDSSATGPHSSELSTLNYWVVYLRWCCAVPNPLPTPELMNIQASTANGTE